ncbi:3-phosphoshikimate 1-carboxyvinyltransferase [Actinacidiphila acididurans]|uniref:3-phosphoshikimate 1-carboxyvinyltransferase n=1 Tax=Actinacidiphila acididurans TaxID=2784346 RepID=A0ABS2TVJ9_9ACTN|nr:3-phosphoshikimate 1-carboxyvinyltransferase [Actinacidiphila acididurans]MBM9506827.1 3-phosphoshikimate 1-carboxyvinyltransferase [Actinacidiphila acididurans]
MLLKVDPVDSFSGTFRVPSSKPETQRAILTGTLAEGTSRVFNDLRCDETETMKNACRAFGAEITEHDGYLEIRGTGRSFRHHRRVIQSRGSGLVFRTMTALASVQPSPVVVTGDATLRNRVMEPLLRALRELGADIESIVSEDKAPVVNWGGGLKGGVCRLPGDISSQFVTAVLFAAPLADGPVEIEVTGDVYSQSYIRQTLASLTGAGIKVSASDDLRHYQVEPSSYRAQDVTTHEDYTSASYLLAAAALFPGRTVLTDVYGDSMQGEFAIVPILEQLGVTVTFDRATSSLTVDNPPDSLRGSFEVNVQDCPNIVPTLAALGAYVQGSLRVTGGRLTRFHKASRIEAMATELTRMGVDIEVLYDDGICDGFEVRGARSYPGGATLSSWGDHRVFMSLFVAGLRMRSANRFAGFEDVRLSFPAFLTEFAKAGVRTTAVEGDGDAGGVVSEAMAG